MSEKEIAARKALVQIESVCKWYAEFRDCPRSAMEAVRDALGRYDLVQEPEPESRSEG